MPENGSLVGSVDRTSVLGFWWVFGVPGSPNPPIKCLSHWIMEAACPLVLMISSPTASPRFRTASNGMMSTKGTNRITAPRPGGVQSVTRGCKKTLLTIESRESAEKDIVREQYL